MTSSLPFADHAPFALLVAARFGGLAVYAPIVSSRAIPARMRTAIVVAVALAATPLLAARGVVGPDVGWSLALVAAVLAELLIGLLIGFLAGLPLAAAHMGGLVGGQQMGFGFASLYGAGPESETDALARFLFLVAIAGFLVMGGHEALLLAVLHSYEHLPPGATISGAHVVEVLGGTMLAAFELALRVAAPVLALGLIQSLSIGLLARTAPQMNILSLGFPIRLLAGILAVAVSVIVLDDVLVGGIDVALAGIMDWLEGVGHA